MAQVQQRGRDHCSVVLIYKDTHWARTILRTALPIVPGSLVGRTPSARPNPQRRVAESPGEVAGTSRSILGMVDSIERSSCRTKGDSLQFLQDLFAQGCKDHGMQNPFLRCLESHRVLDTKPVQTLAGGEQQVQDALTRSFLLTPQHFREDFAVLLGATRWGLSAQ